MSTSKKVSSTESLGLHSGSPSASNESISSQGEERLIGLQPDFGQKPSETYGQLLYDCCAFVICCPFHDKLALNSKGRGLWLPFVVQKPVETWKEAAFAGALYILSNGNISDMLKLPETPFGVEPRLIQIQRLQVPRALKIVTRTTFSVIIKHKSIGSWKCCQETDSLKWVSIEALKNGQVDRIWGPEPNIFLHQVKTQPESLTQEEHPVEEFLRFAKREEEMIKASAFKPKDIQKLMGEFLQHTYPSSYLTYYSFAQYMVKIGWTPNDPRLIPTFRAFNFREQNFRKTSYLSFEEFILGLIAMDADTPQASLSGEIRCGYIFRYYDENRAGHLDYEDVKRMTKDWITAKNGLAPNDSVLETETLTRWESLKAKPTDDHVLQVGLVYAVASKRLRGSSSLFRSPVNVLQSLAAKNVNDTVQAFANSPAGIGRRKYRGTCPGCRAKKYTWAAHTLLVNGLGYTSDLRTLVGTEDIPFDSKDPLTKILRTYSDETVFKPDSIANIINGHIIEYDEERRTLKKNGKLNQLKTWLQMDRELLHIINTICKQAEEIFEKEDRVVKVNSPCYVFGDIHGNLNDLVTYQRMFWKKSPSLSAASYLFLGDYVDRGDFGVECITYLLTLKILAPEKFFLLRGNHEIKSIQKLFTFEKECIKKYGEDVGNRVFDAFNRVFDKMPMAAVIDEAIFCSHGGIPATVSNIEDLLRIPCPLFDPEGQAVEAWEMVWNDPVNPLEAAEIDEFQQNVRPPPEGFLHNHKRGTAYFYTEQAVDKFLEINGLTNIIRGHEVIKPGFKFHYNGKVITIFSSSNYQGTGNKAAAIFVDSEKMRVLRLDTSM